ncbi:hypothetical protein [Amycolatopsis kentuckyensis]|uniref:hypothetical protein n=1 Tax=Amycolatopsis kentuckyensis TaxID=218823 RepID=UPI0035692514
MHVAADAVPAGSPWWLSLAGLVGAILIAYIGARAPVWLEKAKLRLGSSKPADPPATVEKSAAPTSGEAVLREWLRDEQRTVKRLERRAEALERRADALEQELYRRGWDGRLP